MIASLYKRAVLLGRYHGTVNLLLYYLDNGYKPTEPPVMALFEALRDVHRAVEDELKKPDPAE